MIIKKSGEEKSMSKMKNTSIGSENYQIAAKEYKIRSDPDTLSPLINQIMMQINLKRSKCIRMITNIAK